jgi:Transmembrane Fragile-X-F protein
LQAEKELIGQRYSVVQSATSPEFEVAQKLKKRARQDMMKSVFRVVFVVFIILQLDGYVDWSWWIVFLPFWVATFAICFVNYQSFAEVQKMAADKDPSIFGLAGDATPPATNYGAVGADGEATPGAANGPSALSEEEREELKAQVGAAGSKVCSKCCYQGFLVILICLFIGKLQGASFSSFWIISPFLLSAGIILCCLGLAIFGITEVPTDGVEFDTGDFGSAESSEYVPAPGTATIDPELGGQGADTAPQTSGLVTPAATTTTTTTVQVATPKSEPETRREGISDDLD